MQVISNTPKVITRKVYFSGRWWLSGVMVKRDSVIHASWPDNGRRVYSFTERAR